MNPASNRDRKKMLTAVAAVILIALPIIYFVSNNQDVGARGLFDVPLPLGTHLVEFRSGSPGEDVSETYFVQLSTSEIRAFFREKLIESGWRSARSSEPRRLNFENGHQLLSVVTPSPRDTFILIGGRQ